MKRSSRNLAQAAGKWVGSARHHFAWSEQDLMDRISRLQGYFRVVRVPEVEDVERLEAGLEKHIPAWVKYARLAVELEQLHCEADRVAWAEARSPWQGDHPHDALDCCWPLVTRQEFMLLEELDRMGESHRQAAFRLSAAWNSPYADRDKVFQATMLALAGRMHRPLQQPPSNVALRLILEGDTSSNALDENCLAVLEAYLMSDKTGQKAIISTAISELHRQSLDTRAQGAEY